jgi:hypothetical protein
MSILRVIRHSFSFYKSYLLLSLVITACCLWLFGEYGLSIFFALFWFKIVTLALTFYYINNYKSKQYYYYHNLGLSKAWLWGITLPFDFALFLFLIILTYHLK